MGYLDGSTITVDAVLTKYGRRLLSRGTALGINSFCLSDTGIDYNLWNTDHPSGSAFYGEAIESLPQTEALAQGEYEMRNRLVTLPRSTTALPIIDLQQPPAFKEGEAVATERNVGTWSVATLNYSPADSWIVVIPNRQHILPVTGVWSDIAGVAHQFIAAADIPSAGMIEIKQGADGRGELKLRPAADDQDRFTTLTFISTQTGVWAAHSNLKIPKQVIKVDVSNL